jgi:prephenate dehydrogenase (NADP+)
MGMAWHKSAAYPWETARYVSGIEVIKVNITLRIYAAKWHVYAGLALLNPSAQVQIQQYATSTTELFKLMVEGKESELSERIWSARKNVFGWEKDMEGKAGERAPILLSEDVLDQFSLGPATITGNGNGSAGRGEMAPNSHLSLLAMVDCWSKLGIRPFEHLDVAGTPVFMLWIGKSIPWHDLSIQAHSYRSRRIPLPLPYPRSIVYNSIP